MVDSLRRKQGSRPASITEITAWVCGIHSHFVLQTKNGPKVDPHSKNMKREFIFTFGDAGFRLQSCLAYRFTPASCSQKPMVGCNVVDHNHSQNISYGWETTLTTISPVVHRGDQGKRKNWVNEDTSPHRKGKLEFLHFKAVCFQRTSLDLHWTRSSFLHAAYVLVGLLKVSLSQSHLWLLCCFMWLPWNGETRSVFSVVCSGASDQVLALNNEPIQRKSGAV